MATSGFGEVRALFRNLASRVPDAARSQFKRTANTVVKKAKRYVPEDESLLMESIRIEKIYGDHGRLQIDIVVGGQSVTNAAGRTIDLDQYAILVHEAYETAVAPNGPGDNTKIKMLKNPRDKIGSGFLSRAVDEESDKIERVLGQAISEAIHKERGQ